VVEINSGDIDLDQHWVIDGRPSSRFPVYTRANVGEIDPNPTKPLTYTSNGGWGFEVSWRKSLVRFGAFDMDEFDPDNSELITIIYGYPYLNLSAQRVFGVRMPGATPELIDASFFGGGIANIPPYEPDPRDESPEHTRRMTETIGWILSVESLPEVDATWERLQEFRSKRPDYATLSNRELWEYARPYITHEFTDLYDDHMFIIAAGSIPVGIVQAAAASLGEPGLATRALSGIGDIVSAAFAWTMWDLSRLVARSATLTAAFDAGVAGALDRLRGSDDDDVREFLDGFEDFQLHHGYRCLREMDTASLSWEEDPAFPLTAIERMRLQDDNASPRRGFERLRADRQAVTADMLERLSSDEEAQQQLKAALRAAGLFLGAREKTKAGSVLVLNEARTALHELGRRLVAAGQLKAVEDFGMVRYDEFDAFVDDPASFSQEIDRRRRWYHMLADLEPPFITVGNPDPPSTWRRRTEEHLDPVTVGHVFAGIGACPGTATGRARIIRDPHDGGDLEPGEVLVAEATDPAWTPLFMAAAAVVVDVGAPMSHAAIVSRELGIPCVVSAAHASRTIPDGAMITVDGASGTVTVISL
jgi:phosphohistidine swiveling domain-containing protein